MATRQIKRPNPPVPSAAPMPPGPSVWRLPALLWRMRRNQLDVFSALAGEFGDVVKVPFGRTPVYLLSDPAEIEHVHLRSGKDFHKGYGWDPFLGNGLVNSEGDFWRRQRRLVQPAFHRQRINAYAETMVARTERMLERWGKSAGARLDAHAEMMRLTLGIAVETLFDAEVEDEAATVGRVIDEATREAAGEVLGFFGLPEWVPTPGRARTRRAVEELDRVVLGMISERRAEGGDRGDLLSMLIAAQDEEGGGMSDRQLRDEVMTLFLAGHETTASALTWTWVLLDRSPETEERLLCELGEVLGGRRAAVGDVPRLPFADAVIKEAMRLYPPVPVVGRRASEGTVLGGYRVPKGTQLLMSPWILQRDERYFPDPERFDPTRWLGDEHKELPGYAYFPFGGGPRKCIGSVFATVEAVLILATVARRFRVRVTGPVETDASAFGVRPVAGVPFRALPRGGS